MLSLIVAPLAGAWIEISYAPLVWSVQCPVAPLAGAWIEIQMVSHFIHAHIVAPLAGAWIEILIV